MKAYVLSKEGIEFVAVWPSTGNTYISGTLSAARWFDTSEDANEFLQDDCWQLLGKFHVYEVECKLKKV